MTDVWTVTDTGSTRTRTTSRVSRVTKYTRRWPGTVHSLADDEVALVSTDALLAPRTHGPAARLARTTQRLAGHVPALQHAHTDHVTNRGHTHVHVHARTHRSRHEHGSHTRARTYTHARAEKERDCDHTLYTSLLHAWTCSYNYPYRQPHPPPLKEHRLEHSPDRYPAHINR